MTKVNEVVQEQMVVKEMRKAISTCMDCGETQALVASAVCKDDKGPFVICTHCSSSYDISSRSIVLKSEMTDTSRLVIKQLWATVKPIANSHKKLVIDVTDQQEEALDCLEEDTLATGVVEGYGVFLPNGKRPEKAKEFHFTREEVSDEVETLSALTDYTVTMSTSFGEIKVTLETEMVVDSSEAFIKALEILETNSIVDVEKLKGDAYFFYNVDGETLMQG